MAQITGGLVSIEDGIKKGEEYAPPRKVRVELSFSVPEGEDYVAVFNEASATADARVATLLGIAPTLSEGGEAETPASPPAQRRVRRTKAQIDADNAAKAQGSTAGSSSGAPPTGENTGGASSADPSAITEDPSVIALGDQSKGGDDPAAIGGEEDWSSPPATEETKPITDADLNSAVQKKNADLQNPDAIRALIGSYNPDPTQVFQLRQIPADKRAEFLTKLAALTKAA